MATDLRSGEPVVLERGNLGKSMNASMAVPAVLTPVEIDGRLLADGALVRNLRVDVDGALGAERIPAADISSHLENLSEISLSSIASQSLAIFGEENVRQH